MRLHGSLENCSAFPYENFLCRLKASVKHKRRLLQETALKIMRQRCQSGCSQKQSNYKIIKNKDGSIRAVINGQFRFSKVYPDCYFIATNGKLHRIIDFLNDNENGIIYLCEVLHHLESAFHYPCDSLSLGIFRVTLKHGNYWNFIPMFYNFNLK